MSDSDVTTVYGITNDTPDSCVEVRCDCPTLWSMAQQFCYMRLSNKKGEKGYRLISYFPARARRIAATYARLYLEQEEHGDPAKKGRYYWMALGAFASKTVACSLEDWRTKSRIADTVRINLGKGNFWLFNDIAAWHWYYNVSPDSFDQCLDHRNAGTYVSDVKRITNKLPWAGESLPAINHLKVTQEVKKGFDWTKKIETTTDKTDRQFYQMQNLMALARHEQGNILQKLIYNNSDFVRWLERQRGILSWVSPDLKVAFVSACDTDDPALINSAPENTRLEDYQSRMDWITAIAKQFHQRMIDHVSQMEGELAIMAGWVNTRDSIVYVDESPAR
jgi:hypothetical protein